MALNVVCVLVCVCQVVGLGNPGMEGTRHSIGMAVLGALAARLGVADRWRGDKHVSGEVIVSEVQHTHVVLLRPRLLMNINGVSVAKAGELTPEDILLVHDELDKPLGKIAVKHGGSARSVSFIVATSWTLFWSRVWTSSSPSSPSNRTLSPPPHQQRADEQHRREKRGSAQPLQLRTLLLLRAESLSF
uniref:Peptidyl-tRNA hydrolase 1 homolog n=1 Tax=Lates calcarifer TaxID=8187 RepID=A0A4W6CS16_LATCA